MARKRLTDKVIKSLKTSKSQEDIWDSGVKIPGVSFGVRVTSQGTKEFVARYRLNGRYRRVSLGNAKLNKSLADAHAEAVNIAKLIEDRKDPAQIRDEYKAAETCDELFELYLKHHAAFKKDAGANDKGIIERDLNKALGTKKAVDVTRRDIIAILEHIANDRKAPVSANRTRALLSKIFNFALEREIITTSPCVGLPRKTREKAKERVLTDEEIRTIWAALSTENPLNQAAVKLILLTGQRPGEVLGAKWSEINLKSRVWTIPAERTKNGREHTVPLSKSAKEVLLTIKMMNRRSEYVLPGQRGARMASRTLQNATRRLSLAPGQHSFTAHDLRRTAATRIRSMGISREVVAQILNHTPQTVTAIYDRHKMIPEMQDALEQWAETLQQIISAQAETDLKESA